MKAVAKATFFDLENNIHRIKGEVFECSEKRHQELSLLDLVEKEKVKKPSKSKK